MELSFVCDSAADASYIAQELELLLRESKVPADALSLKQSSHANMDIGSVLSVSMEIASNILGPIGALATCTKCILEVVARNNSPVVIIHEGGSRYEISPEKATPRRVEDAICKRV